jgi:hypothetical protein
MAICAFVAGCVGIFLAKCGVFVLPEPLASRVPVDKHVAFSGDLWAQSASYLVGFVGGIVVITSVWRTRARTNGGSSRRESSPSGSELHAKAISDV